MAGPRAASGLPWDVACAAESYAGACAYGTGLALSKWDTVPQNDHVHIC